MDEFELIRRYFGHAGPARDDVRVGIGDDAAIVRPPEDSDIAIATDTLVAGVHFPDETHPADIGYKALAVNLSDLAAMGAVPAWFTLNLTLPEANAPWLEAFARGLFELAQRHRVQLIGGDTTRGPLAVTVTVHGFVPRDAALLRGGARPGDRVYVTGLLGEAALALRFLRREVDVPEEFRAVVLSRLNRPQPRIAAGVALRGLASACIDVSDGVAADLGHILDQSGVGATIELKRLPVSDAYDAAFATLGWGPALSGGDDYELCFTLPPEKERALHQVTPRLTCTCTPIGVIDAERGLRVRDEAGALFTPAASGYNHFRHP